MNDADLVARARQGDAAAFGTLVDRHRQAVYRAARAALHSHEDAEDAAQDAFISAFQRLGSFRGEASFKTWLLTIAWHEAISRRRSLGRWWKRIGRESGAVEHDGAAGVNVMHPSPSPEQEASGSELRRAIVGEIRALPPKLRDTLLLAQAGDLTYDEIATMTKAPVGTIKWRVSEARKRIKAGLAERGFSDVG